MDQNTEKELIDVLKSIAGSLNDIKAELTEISVAIRETNSYEIDEEEK
jgi:hypothetical protein